MVKQGYVTKNLLVEVYKNVRKHCWSVRAGEGARKGRVITHTHTIVLKDALFVVREGGRQRVLVEKSKNVHAFIKGRISVSSSPDSQEDLLQVTYNPYHNETFVFLDGRPVHQAALVVMDQGKVWVQL